MSRTLAVDKDNNPVVGNDGNLVFAAGEAAVAHISKHFVKALLGEMMYKADQGMPIFSAALGASANLAQFETAFRARMKEIPDILSVRSFQASIDNGVLRYVATIETVHGISQLQGDTQEIG